MLNSTEKEAKMTEMRAELARLIVEAQQYHGPKAQQRVSLPREYLLEMDKALIDLKPRHKIEATSVPESVAAAYRRL
jgi:hypothetical protein